jgi:hypothetical protein
LIQFPNVFDSFSPLKWLVLWLCCPVSEHQCCQLRSCNAVLQVCCDYAVRYLSNSVTNWEAVMRYYKWLVLWLCCPVPEQQCCQLRSCKAVLQVACVVIMLSGTWATALPTEKL